MGFVLGYLIIEGALERLQHMGMGLFRRILGNGFGSVGYMGMGLDYSRVGL